MEKGKRKPERHKTGPKGELRPMSETSNAVRTMEIATGLADEQYTDGRRPKPKRRVRIL